MLKYAFNRGFDMLLSAMCPIPYVRLSENPRARLRAEIDREAAMDTLADRQEGRAVGMVRFGAARTLDDCRHGNDNAEQEDP